MAFQNRYQGIRQLSLCCRSGRNLRGFDLQTQRIGRGDAGWRRRLSLARQHSQNHIAIGEARLQRLGTGGLNRGQSVIEHRAQDFDELAVGVGMRLQPLNGAPLRKAPGGGSPRFRRAKHDGMATGGLRTRTGR